MCNDMLLSMEKVSRVKAQKKPTVPPPFLQLFTIHEHLSIDHLIHSSSCYLTSPQVQHGPNPLIAKYYLVYLFLNMNFFIVEQEHKGNTWCQLFRSRRRDKLHDLPILTTHSCTFSRYYVAEWPSWSDDSWTNALSKTTLLKF